MYSLHLIQAYSVGFSDSAESTRSIQSVKSKQYYQNQSALARSLTRECSIAMASQRRPRARALQQAPRQFLAKIHILDFRSINT